MTLDQLQAALPEYFAPWVQALGLHPGREVLGEGGLQLVERHGAG